MKYHVVIAFFVVIFILAGCQYSDLPTSILATGDTVTLAWNPPDPVGVNVVYAVEAYHIYYRERGMVYWAFIGEVSADDDLQIVLEHDAFGDGMYEFSVRAVNQKGAFSPFHTSTDQHADPFGGWYLLWLNSEPN